MDFNLKGMKNMKRIALLVFAGTASLMLFGCKEKKKAPVIGRDTSNADKTLRISKADSLKKMRQLANDSGYRIQYDLRMGLEKEEVDAKAFHEAACFQRKDGSGIALNHADPYYHVYLKDAEKEAFDYLMSFKSDVYDQWYGEGSMMFYAHNLNLSYVESSSATFLDRACTVYTFEYDYAVKEKKPYTLYLDNELGITLKIECTKADAAEEETIAVEAKLFEIGGDVEMPDLPAPAEIVDGDAKMKEEWHDVIPEKISFSCYHGVLNEDYPEYEHTEIIGNDALFYRQNRDGERAFFYKWDGSHYQAYYRDYADEGGWEKKDLPINSAIVGKNETPIQMCLSFNAGGIDPFQLSNLYNTRMTGYDSVLGLLCSIYETNEGYRYFLNEENSLILKIESKDAYRFEIIDFSYAIEGFLDSPDDPLKDGPNYFGLGCDACVEEE